MGPRILTVDIETSPIEAYVWGLYDQNVGLNQVKKDWQIISWAAKWLDQKKVIQFDTRSLSEEVILKKLQYLLSQADIVVTQNGKSFDIKKINARFLHYDILPANSFRQIDTKILAKKYFGFTSNSLEYMSKKFNAKYKKLKHGKFPGMELWVECLKGNKSAWNEMAKYNKYDVLATEELYKRLIPFDNSINFTVYYPKNEAVCSCGSTEFRKDGFRFTNSGKYQQYECIKCYAKKKHYKNIIGRKILK